MELPAPTVGEAPFSFDGEAAGFDHRAGLPAAAAERVAAAVLDLAGLGPGESPIDPGVRPGAAGTERREPRRAQAARSSTAHDRPRPAPSLPEHWLLDLGAGTGEIGESLAGASGTLRYLGLDLSLSMLARFRRKLRGDAGRALLAAADADRPWPVAGGRVTAVFSSRAVHLFDLDHLVAEILRVIRPQGGVVILGRVRRGEESVRAEMRRRMRRLASEHGVEGRSGERGRCRLLAALEESGGAILPPREAAVWEVSERPADSLASWRSKPGLAGRALPPELRDAVLAELEVWARRRWGDLETPHRATERYELLAVSLPAWSHRAAKGA